MLRVYGYKGCDTCRKASKWLTEHGVAHEQLPIREQAPGVEELRMALHAGYALKQLFNSSGGDYRQLGMKEKLPSMGEAEALDLLSANGNLVKRPFVISQSCVLVGFYADQWREVLLG